MFRWTTWKLWLRGPCWVEISWDLDELCRNFLSSHCRYRVFFCTHKKNMSPVFDCFCWDNKNFEWNAAHIYLHQMLLLPACSIRPVRPSGIKTQVSKAPKATVMMIAGRKGISEGAKWPSWKVDVAVKTLVPKNLGFLVGLDLSPWPPWDILRPVHPTLEIHDVLIPGYKSNFREAWQTHAIPEVLKNPSGTITIYSIYSTKFFVLSRCATWKVVAIPLTGTSHQLALLLS